jgi:hypothetical protein
MKNSAILLASAALIPLATPAFAQNATAANDQLTTEIVVTAQRAAKRSPRRRSPSASFHRPRLIANPSPAPIVWFRPYLAATQPERLFHSRHRQQQRFFGLFDRRHPV